MKKVVTVQANTVEEAIQQALIMLEVPLEQVQVEVLTNPGRRLMGLRKALAEVKVTSVDQVGEPPIARELSKIEELASLLDDVDLNGPQAVNRPAKKEIPDMNNQSDVSAARIQEGKIQFQFNDNSLPSIIPNENALLYVNGELCTQPISIQPEDQVTLTICDEVVAPKFTIQLIEKNMIALLSFTPGKRIKRSLANTAWSPRLAIRVDEVTEVTNDIKPQQIVDELKVMGVQQGLVFPAIKKATEVDKPYELIVAKGTLPVEGTDGDLEVHVRYEAFDPNSEEKVDFREMNAITNVKEGQVIATHVLPVEGTAGRSLLGHKIPVKPVRDVILRLGKNVEQVDRDLVALISGKPVIVWRDRLVEIEVNSEFNHPGEVSLESGNIRFEGDVRIGGNILPSMFVGATGSIFVGGSITKATIHAMKSVMVRGNVLSSTISVGKQEAAINELARLIKEVTHLLVQIKEAVDQIFIIRGQGEADLNPSELKRLIQLLMEKRYAQLEDLNKQFIQKVRSQKATLDEEWTNVADSLYDIFINPINEDMQNLEEFGRVVEEAQILAQLYDGGSSLQTKLSVPYAINSTLYSNGHIEVYSKGVYHCNLSAEQTIKINGVCRGGEISAPFEIVLQESGSKNPVKTVIRTSAEGCIKIGRAFAGTEIYVGIRKHVFTKDGTNITARLNAEGELDLG
ncbi:FapA family protein [Sporosarcina sp. GW1-11]|uniref:FapA family protein n=1 Tax=Sporosarcina sp. GW1-11 TaxID=2899126 RepID=UPI00294CF43D|nr:FapA family protein [Sporosarcina sp. GW1-11]MDV6378343.1 FapA family protein [Sporosarcina sp. GW1-11]